MSRDARVAFRRTKRMAVAVGAASLLTYAVTDPGAAAPGAPAQGAPFNAGTGTAIALAYKVNPVFGGLSFGITAGESVAGHQNTGANAQSKAINLGVIGVTLAGEGCEGADPTLPEASQPQPLLVSSTDPGAAQGKKASDAAVIEKFARATPAPFAEAVTTVAPLGNKDVALIQAGVSKATSGVVEPGVREARATTTIASVSLLGGLVKLGDLKWEAIQRTGAKTTNSGTFSLGSLIVSGVKIPLPTEALDVLKLLEETLGAVGLEIKAPQVRVAEGIVFVDPMKIGIVPSLLRDGLIQPILEALQPTREDLVDALESISCGGDPDLLGNNSKTVITVLDLALGAISGAGSLSVELGGVQATTDEIEGFDGLGVLPDPPVLDDLPDLPPSFDTPDFGGGFDTDFGDVAAPPVSEGSGSSPSSRTPTSTPTQPIADVDGERGGVLLGVGAAGLLLLLATAEGDRRKMRRAMREIPLEV